MAPAVGIEPTTYFPAALYLSGLQGTLNTFCVISRVFCSVFCSVNFDPQKHMATLYKDNGNPNWFARFTDADGKRISRSTGTPKKREAAAIATDFETQERNKRKGNPGLPSAYAAIVNAAAREAAAGELTLARAEELVHRLHSLANPSFRVVSLEAHLDEWVRAQEQHVEDNTIRVYMDMKRRVIAAVGPKIATSPVGSLTRTDVEKALGKIVKMKIRGSKTRTITAATANMDLRALRRALQVALEEGLAKANVAAAVRPLPQTDSTEKAPFTAAEVRSMIDHPKTNAEWQGAILIGAHTGLRLGDVVKLTRSHLEGSRLIIRPTKTKKDRKTLSIPLTPPVIEWIGNRQGDFFPSLAKVKKGTLSTTFTRIMRSAGVPRDIVEAGDVVKRRSFHSLRHSFASWLAEQDIHADIRQKLTGHSSSGIHSLYTHHDEALDRAVSVLPSFG
jgi:integrase